MDMAELVDVESLLNRVATEGMVDIVDWRKVNMVMTHGWKNVKIATTKNWYQKSTDIAQCNVSSL